MPDESSTPPSDLRERVLAAFVAPEVLEEALHEANAALQAAGVARPKSRFAQIMADVRRDLTGHRTDRRWSSFAAHSELRHVTRIFQRWRRDPLAHGVIREAVTSARYTHHVVLLAAATYLEAAGNDVQLLAPTPPRKTPDLLVRVAGADVFIEVKARDELIEPAGTLGDAVAAQLIQRCLHRASRQLSAAGFGVLAIGGLRVPTASLDALKRVAPSELARSSKRAHIAGGLFFSVGTRLEDVPIDVRPTPEQWARMGWHERLGVHVNPRVFLAEVACRAATNPGYAGTLPVLGKGEPGPGLRLPYS